MKSQIRLLFVFCFLFLTSYAQDKGVVLKEKSSDRTVFLQENKRIKLKTKDGKVFVGKFKIVDDNTIMIKNATITLDSISTIKRRSLVSSIGSPFVVAGGTILMIAGVAGALSGGYGVLLVVLIPPGIPMILVPVISNNHVPEKWSYSIDTNPKLKLE